ncbi:MAG: hypothetical protein IPL78_12860 [Chloroflexi bacterium]|nr:hypothetical protein [Chloroflexota bacterium]
MLVPGHGHVAKSRPHIEQRIREDREYLGELRSRVTDAIAQAKPSPKPSLYAPIWFPEPEKTPSPINATWRAFIWSWAGS